MKKNLLCIAVIFAFFQTNSNAQNTKPDVIIVNNYTQSFNLAYQLHPDIPKGILEAVSFCNTHFNHIQHAVVQPQSCTGIPNTYGVMGLTLDGQNYFANNLVTVSTLSGINVNDIINDPAQNILAYAAAYSSVKNLLAITDNTIESQLPVLKYLSELPHTTLVENFALNTQLYGYLQFLKTPAYQQVYGFSNYAVNFERIFGVDNLAVLSAVSVLVTDESVICNTGQHFNTPTGKSTQSTDYAPAAWVSSPNYSSRSGTAISAVTIHDVEGSYAGCISWFQNTSSNVSAHYVCRSSDGQLTEMVIESNKAWHVGSENPYTIGIEHEGYVNQTGWYTNAMYAGSAALIRDICTSGYGINPIRAWYGPSCSGSCVIGACTKIKGHQHYPNQTHNDPGPNWNWAYYYLLTNNNPTISTVTGASGNFYDSGGAGANYADDERLLTLIQPSGATSVTLNFTAFDTELNWDYIFIYDGTTTSAPLLGQYSGTTSPGTVTSSGGAMLIEFRSDCSTNAAGWAANWTSNAVPSPSVDSIAPTTVVSTVNAWETVNFTASFTDADNTGGSGLEKSYYQVTDYNGTEWRANGNNGFFADDFNVAIHPDWTSAVGTWSINTGALYQADETNSNTNIYASLNQTLSNRYLYNFTAKIGGTGTTKRAGFHFFSDNGSLPNRGNSYFVWFRVDDAKLQIYKVVNDVFGTPVVDIPFTTVANQWYDYKVIYDRITGKISVYRDNQFITSWTDSSPYSTGNAISFRSGNANFAINDLKVFRSRASTATISLGAANTNDIRYQNPNPTTYSGKIKTICADSAGNLSGIFFKNINVDWTTPSPVDTINDGTGADIATTSSMNTLSANWSSSIDVNSAIAKYWYAIGTTPGATNTQNFTDNWVNTFVTVTGLNLTLGQTYYFTVKAEDGAGLQSTVFSSNGQTVSTTTSIDEQLSSNGLSAYPNPFTNTTNIIYQLTGTSNVEITLTDVLGKKVVLYNNPNQAQGKHQLSINSADLQLAKGMYFMKLVTDQGQKFVKVVLK